MRRGRERRREEPPRASHIPGVPQALLCVSDPHSPNPLDVLSQTGVTKGTDLSPGGRSTFACSAHPLPASRWLGGPFAAPSQGP